MHFCLYPALDPKHRFEKKKSFDGDSFRGWFSAQKSAVIQKIAANAQCSEDPLMSHDVSCFCFSKRKLTPFAIEVLFGIDTASKHSIARSHFFWNLYRKTVEDWNDRGT